jgi:hypothetical protein
MMSKVLMTEQEVYNHVVRHLQVQGERAHTPMQCVYKDLNTGLKCAVGCLIPACEYDAEGMEGASLEGLGEYLWPAMARLGVLRTETMQNLLSALQGAHDKPGNWVGEPLASSSLPKNLTERLRDIAQEFNLVPLF